MIRIVIIALVLSACITRTAPAPQAAKPAPVVEAPKPAPAPVNLVCQAFEGVNQTAKCEPHHTDVGELHIHTATVTLGQTQFACRQDLSMLGVLCSEPITIKQQPPAPVEDKGDVCLTSNPPKGKCPPEAKKKSKGKSK